MKRHRFPLIVVLLILFPFLSLAHGSAEKFSVQILVVEPVKGEMFKAKVTAWQKIAGQWKVALGPMDAVVGRNGLAEPGQKREGDGKTPSGVYDLGPAFGYDQKIDTHMNYQPMTKDDIWVDDQNSKNYNRLITKRDLGDAKSFEEMKRDDDLYKAGLVIQYNTDPIVPGFGSAIFLHIWRGFDKPTSGCVALSEDNVLRILKWLNASDHPMITINKR
ncbi:MAG: L,D-transpeptidase family protein [Candidatus Omnitrophica bacterium]|nr:L,D-transpeptidase family protein [Candidatus Omnitrophota bacterium]